MSQDEIKTTGSCCSITVNDLVSGRISDIFLYLLLRKQSAVNDLLRKAYTSFVFFCSGTIGGWAPKAPSDYVYVVGHS